MGWRPMLEAKVALANVRWSLDDLDCDVSSESAELSDAEQASLRAELESRVESLEFLVEMLSEQSERQTPSETVVE